VPANKSSIFLYSVVFINFFFLNTNKNYLFNKSIEYQDVQLAVVFTVLEFSINMNREQILEQLQIMITELPP